MNNNNDGNYRPVIKEQLLPLRAFIEYCSYDYHRNKILDCVDEKFIRAAELDGFLKPLLEVKEDTLQKTGRGKNR